MDPITRTAPDLPGKIILSQSWRELVFIHWRIDAAEVAPFLPAGIIPDEFDGSSWIGLIPFGMHDSAAFGGPAVPYFGSFTEVNVRLYGVDRQGRRGVVFLSLEASRLAAVLTARALFTLPYFWARASLTRADGQLRYRSTRISAAAPATLIVARPSSVRVTDNALAEFLTARWTLFETRAGRTIAMFNEHDPWELFEAELVELRDELIAASGIGSVGLRAPDSVLYSPGVITRFSAPQTLA